MINVVINGDKRKLESEISLNQLLDMLELPTARIAVELNQQVVSRTNWQDTKIRDHDRLEIIHFVGGG